MKRTPPRLLSRPWHLLRIALLMGLCAGTARATGQGGAFYYFRSVEICDNGLDDDGDGLTDCEDTDCLQLSNGGFESVPVAPYPGSSFTFPPYPNAIGGWSAVNIDGEVFYGSVNKPPAEGNKYASLLQNAGANPRIPWTENSWNGGGYDRFAYLADVTPGEPYELSFYHAADNRYNYLGNHTLIQVQSMETGYYYDTLLVTPGFFAWERVSVPLLADAETQRLAILFSSWGPSNSSVVIDGVNFCPLSEQVAPALVALNDSAATIMNFPVQVPVLDNDLQVPAAGYTLTVTEAPLYGQATVLTGGRIAYQPLPNHACTDSFTYRVCNQAGEDALCDEAVVYITVHGLPPVAVEDSAVGREGENLIVALLANDHDPDNALNPATVRLASVGAPRNGSVIFMPDGTATYLPEPGFAGLDSFVYVVEDVSLPVPLRDSAQVSVRVEAAPPVMTVDTFFLTLLEDGNLDICASDYFETDPGLSSWSVCAEPLNGLIAGSGSCMTYFPVGDFYGTDGLCLIACDGENCDTSYFVLNVLPVNDPPDVLDDEARTLKNVAVDIFVLLNDKDPDDEPGMDGLTLMMQPLHGSVEKVDNALRYTPEEGFRGQDIFTYQYCDGGTPDYCDEATVRVEVVPTPDTVRIQTLEDVPVAVCAEDFLELPANVNGEIWLCLSSENGYDATESTCYTFAPETDYSGADTVWQVICRRGQACDTIIYLIDIHPVNDAPDIRDDYAGSAAGEPVYMDILANDDDAADGGGLDLTSVTITDEPTYGTVSLNDDGTVYYAPHPGFAGRDSFAYTVCDLGYPMPALCGSARVFIEVEGTTAPEKIPCFIPEAFSPNGDGLYDRFEISCLEYYPDLELVVYDRSGYEVFDSGIGYANSWDGGELPAGTYFWFIRFHDRQTADRAGHVLIWR